MVQLNLPVLMILFPLLHSLFFQQIFDQIYKTCEYLTEDNGPENGRLPMLNKVWRVVGTGRQATTQVLLSPCGTPLPPTLGCDREAAVCILNTKNPQKSILNAGRHFSYIKNKDGQLILQSMFGQPCDVTDNYTVIIEFDCQPSMGIAPTFLYKDDCELHLKMMAPTCAPTCTTREEGNLIDLRTLQGLGSNQVRGPGKSFVVSFCAASNQCGADISACEVTGGGKTSLANIGHQRITFDSESKNLVIKSYFGTNKRGRKNLEVDIRCNWEVPVIANFQYVTPMVQGRNFKFQAESVLACIKLPMNCLIRDHKDDYIVYNLASLNKENGGWNVKNVSGGNIFINICGPLRLPERSICTDQYSQACYRRGTRDFVNLGSIASFVHGDSLKGTFIFGSVCEANSTLTYKTEIEFLCSRVEGGPVLQSVQGCTYSLRWETPAACSKQFKTSDNCVMTDITGIIDLNGIYSTSDREFSFTPSSSLRYNLCGGLNRPCNGKEANICYVKNGQEFVVGYPSKTLTRDGVTLSTTFVGDKCDSDTICKSRVTFSCNYLAPTSGTISVNVVKPDCVFEIYIETPLACAGSKVSDCKIISNNSLFDLSPLTRNDGNYRMRDRNSDIFYYVNICRSVINQGDTLCPAFSGACLYNATEMEVENRYISMGQVGSRSRPRIENGELVIHYDSGKYCFEADSLKRSTIFRFQCSDRELGPTLLKKDSCSHEFIWRTRSACAKSVLSVKTRSATNSVCKYRYPDSEKFLDLSNLASKIATIVLAHGENVTFSVCENNYTYCTLNGTDCKTLKSEVHLSSDEIGVYLEYKLENLCNSTYRTNKLHIRLVCDPLTDNKRFTVRIISISDCTMSVSLLTNLICTSQETYVSNPELVIQPPKEHIYKNDQVMQVKEVVAVKNANTILPSNVDSKSSASPINKQLKKIDCVIKNPQTDYTLNLKDIKPIKVTSPKGTNYIVMVNESSSVCGGYMCKNQQETMWTTEDCPAVELDHVNSMVKLLYRTRQVCESGSEGQYRSEVWFKCNSTVEAPKVVTELECSFQIIYPLKAACLVLESPETSTSGIAIGSSVGLLIIVLAAAGGFLMIKKRSPDIFFQRCYQRIPEDKGNVRMYFKNTNL